jgi:hypothetical protein
MCDLNENLLWPQFGSNLERDFLHGTFDTSKYVGLNRHVAFTWFSLRMGCQLSRSRKVRKGKLDFLEIEELE